MSSLLSEGLSFAKAAVTADAAQDYGRAIEQYRSALAKFQAIIDSKQPYPQQMTAKMNEYSQRLRQIESVVTKTKQPELEFPTVPEVAPEIAPSSTQTQIPHTFPNFEEYPSNIPDGPQFDDAVVLQEQPAQQDIRDGPIVVISRDNDPMSMSNLSPSDLAILRELEQATIDVPTMSSVGNEEVDTTVTMEKGNDGWLPDKQKLQVRPLQQALDLSEQAKELDQKQQYFEAFQTYKQSLDLFKQAFEEETSQRIKASLHKTMQVYVQRAEKIKEYLQDIGQAPPESESTIELPKQERRVIIERHNFIEGNTAHMDKRIGPIQREVGTSFMFSSTQCDVKVNIGKNITFPGDIFEIELTINNMTGVSINQLRICLQETETSSYMDSNVKRQYKRDVKYIQNVFYTKGFPLSRSKYTGVVAYQVPEEVELSDTDNSTSFAREHELVFVFISSSWHKNIKISLPIRIVSELSDNPMQGS